MGGSAVQLVPVALCNPARRVMNSLSGTEGIKETVDLQSMAVRRGNAAVNSQNEAVGIQFEAVNSRNEAVKRTSAP